MRTGWGAAKLHTSETLSKGRLSQILPGIVSTHSYSHRLEGLRNVLVGEAGPQVTKPRVHEEVLEHATPSEEAVRVALDSPCPRYNVDIPFLR